jgi:hypothetical protein
MLRREVHATFVGKNFNMLLFFHILLKKNSYRSQGHGVTIKDGEFVNPNLNWCFASFCITHSPFLVLYALGRLILFLIFFAIFEVILMINATGG